MTTGGSSVQAIERVREYGLEVIGVIGIIDRLAGGAENFSAAGVPYQSLLTIEDFGITPT